MSFALIHEITYWVSVSDLSSSSWWNKRIPWNSTTSPCSCAWAGGALAAGSLGPLPNLTAAPPGARCGSLPLCPLVSFQEKSKPARSCCPLVRGLGWARWAVHWAWLLCSGAGCSETAPSLCCAAALSVWCLWQGGGHVQPGAGLPCQVLPAWARGFGNSAVSLKHTHTASSLVRPFSCPLLVIFLLNVGTF